MLCMKSLNDLIWTDEEVFVEDLVQPAMDPPCSISIPSCDDGGTPYIVGNQSANRGCGC